MNNNTVDHFNKYYTREFIAQIQNTILILKSNNNLNFNNCLKYLKTEFVEFIHKNI